jgi:hypothetical protein
MCGGSGLILKAVPVPKSPVSADPEDRAMWWEENVTRLILSGRTDPLIDPAFLEEWDRTPPPLSSLRWADESGPAPDLARLAEWIPVSREVAE